MAAMAVMTGTLAAEVNAEAYQYSTARVVESTASSTKRTGKQLTYKQAYNRLKDLSIFSGSSPAQTTTKPTTTAKPNQNNTSTKPNQNTQQDKKDAVYMTDHKGNAIPTSNLVFRSTLTKTQQNLYDIIKTAVASGEKSVTFDNYYSQVDLNYAFNAVLGDNPYLVWVTGCNYVNPTNKGVKSLKFTYDSALVKDRAGAVQLMDDYLKPMLDKASKMSTDIDKVKFVHDWLIYNVNDGSAKSSDMHYHMAYSAIVEKKGVCAAYTNAFTYCMQKLGIQCTMLGGTTWNGGGHCWNLLKVGGDWYECDVYWDDVLTESETDYTYTCFMQTTASLKAYDTYNGKCRTRYANCEDLPIANGTKYSPDNYKYANGSNFSDLAKVVITKKTNSSSVKNYTASSKNTSLPSGWYKYKAILIPNKKSIRQSDWTKEGNFYFIEKSSGTYYIYDVAYDNYYLATDDLSAIKWYKYPSGSSKVGMWTTLK